MADQEKHTCTPENAEKFREWIAHRNGIFVWRSVNLSNPELSWSTPAEIDGQPYPRPTWEAGMTPARHITSIDDVVVSIDREVKRFHVAVRAGGNGMQLKVTDGGTRRIRSAVAKAGEGAYYLFDYSTQEAVIYKQDRTIPLADWTPPASAPRSDAALS